MENDIFKAGVSPGGPVSHEEIQVLVCHILTKVDRSMSFAELHETLAEDALVNYFDLVQAVDRLVKTGHLCVREGEDSSRYAATDMGKETAKEFERSLPLSAREKAVRSAERLLLRQKREASVRIRVEKSGGGFQMELAIPEEGCDLISFSLFLPTQEEVDRVRKRFLNDPVFIYKGALALLTGDPEILGSLFPADDPLF